MGSVKYPSVGYKPKLDDGATVVEGSSVTTDDNTEWFDLGDCRYWGLAVAVGTVTGTNPTLDIAAQCRFNGEADVYSYPSDLNTTTQIAMTQLTTSDTNLIEFWRNFLPTMGEYGQARFTFTLTGTSPVFPIAQFVVVKVER